MTQTYTFLMFNPEKETRTISTLKVVIKGPSLTRAKVKAEAENPGYHVAYAWEGEQEEI